VQAQTGMESSPPTAAAPATVGGGINISRSLRRHKGLAIATLLLVILAGLPFAWIRGTAKYSATAVIYVSPRFVANLQDGKEIDLQSDSQYHEYIQQSAKTINRFDIVEEALKKMGPASSGWVEPGEKLDHAAERLQYALDIKPVPDTYQIAVTLERTRPEGLADLVNNVVAVYLTTAKSEGFFDSDQRIKNLTDDRTRLEQDVAAKITRRLEIAQELGVSSFSDNFVNPYDRLLVEAKEALSTADRQKIEADATLASLDEKQRIDGGKALRALAAEEAIKDTALTTFDEKLNIRRTQLMATMSGLSPDHPGRKAGERELAEIEKVREMAYQKLVENYSGMLLAQKSADDYKATRVEQKLNGEVEKQSSQASWFSRNYQEGTQIGVEIDSIRKRIDSIQQRIDFFSLEKSAPGFVRIFSSARVPDQPTSGGRKKLFGVVVVAALFLGLLAPIGADMLDPRLQSPSDVQRILGFPPIAWIMDKAEAGPEFAHEQSLRLANRIAQEQQTAHSRIFAFTSVKAKGGASTLVLETAAALGKLGVPALAVEANAYRADPRYRDPKSRGLTVVLRGNHEINTAVVPGDQDMPDHIPIGDIENEKNIPDIQNLTKILRESTGQYTVVLVDLPPILVSVDAEFIARGSDVVVLVIEAGEVNKAELVRAAASLERLHVNAVSAVLNKVHGDTKDGLAEAALKEFRMGSVSKRPGLLRRWLWK
jgi:polysaccharide biosynthesis transport protein